MNQTLERIERLSHLCRTAHAIQVPLVVQSCKNAMMPSLPTSFLLEEPECTSKLLKHMKVKHVSVLTPGMLNASALASAEAQSVDSRERNRSSP
jgi:hypothetical protein